MGQHYYREAAKLEARARALRMHHEYMLGSTLQQIADAHGITVGRIHQLFKQHELPRRPVGRPLGSVEAGAA